MDHSLCPGHIAWAASDPRGWSVFDRSVEASAWESTLAAGRISDAGRAFPNVVQIGHNHMKDWACTVLEALGGTGSVQRNVAAVDVVKSDHAVDCPHVARGCSRKKAMVL